MPRKLVATVTVATYVWSLAPHLVHAGENDPPQAEAPSTALVSQPVAVDRTERPSGAQVAGTTIAEGDGAPSSARSPASSEGVAAADARAAASARVEAPSSTQTETPKRLVTGADKTGVSSQAISVPQGAGKIQGMGESFSAQLSTGIATFSVPFALPSARGGAQPSLGLSYSSSSGHGIAGVGWDIGVPSISRQSDRGVPKYDDPSTSTNKFKAEQDRFVFNGGQELVPICTVGLDCAGQWLKATYGDSTTVTEAPPSWANGWMYFRPRVEGGFQRFFWSADHKTWVVQDKSGSTLELGVAPDETSYTEALEVDPENHDRVYRWNLIRQYDAQRSNGAPVNVVRYRYWNPDGVAYLSDIFDTTPVAAATSTDTRNFAHHTHLRYEPRPDPTFSYQRGWRASSTQRLAGVDVSSKTFSNAEHRKLLRRYNLTYVGGSHVSLLLSVQMEGRCGNPGTPEDMEPVGEGADQLLDTSACPKLPALPAMTFEYQHVNGFDTKGASASSDLAGYEPFDARIRTMTASPPHSIDEEMTELFDINADGLPDVLVTDPASYGGKHGVYFNGDRGKADDFRPDAIGVKGVNGDNATVLTLRNLNLTVSDIDGDAVANLVHMPIFKTYSVYEPKFITDTTLVPSVGWWWLGRTATLANAKIDFGKDASELHVMDVNADGLVDVVRTTGTQIETYLALGRYPGGYDRYGQGKSTAAATADLSSDPIAKCLPWSATPVRFSDSETRVADMNGDGLPDLVRVQKGAIRYWPGRGNGMWGTGSLTGCDAGSFGSGREILMATSPQFTAPDTSSLRLDDVNGDGLDDLVQVRFSDVDVWLNVDGTGWTDRHTISDTPTSPSYSSRLRLVDINGSGTRDLLWGDGLNYRYIDLQGGERPWVLIKVENGLGKSTEIEYASSTSLMQAAAKAGKPWSSVAPMPMHVVVRETERDNLASLGRPAGVYVTEYEYENPRYDGVQREFRGFASARAKRIGDANSPTAVTASEFVLGDCWVDGSPCTYQNRDKDNEHEALKGLPAISETYDTTGVYLSTLHHQYTLKKLYSGLDGRGVYWAYESRTDSWLYDTGPFSAGGGSPALDDVVLPGPPSDPSNVVSLLKGTQTIQGARGAHLKSSSSVDDFGNATKQTDFGADDDEWIYSHTTPTLVPNEGNWTWRTKNSWVDSDRDSTARHSSSVSYDSRGNALSTTAHLQGSLPLTRANPPGGGTAPAPSRASADGDILVASSTYDSFGLVLNSTGARGRYREIEYDAQFRSLPLLERVFVGGIDDASADSGAPVAHGGQPLTARVKLYDRGLGAILEVSDLHEEKTTVAYDGFGRTVSLSKPSPTLAHETSPYSSIELSYKLPPETGGPYSILETRVQIGDTEASNAYRSAYAYVDGLGRTILTIDQADPEHGDMGPWIVNGLTEYDAKGAASRAYRAWFWDGVPDAEHYPLSTMPTSKYGRQRYDAFGRQLQTFGLDGTVTLQSSYHALSSDAWDAADLSPGPHYGTYASAAKDGHGRSVSTTERIHGTGGIEARETTSEYLPSGEVVAIHRHVVGSATDVVRWMQYDTLGRMVLNVEPNTTADFTTSRSTPPLHAWRYAYDDAADLVGTSDARGCGVNYIYDYGGRLLAEDYWPCQPNHAVYSAPIWSSGAGIEVRYKYDFADSDVPIHDDCPIDTSLLLGRLVSVEDRAAKTVTGYDGRGRATCIARKLSNPTGTGYVDDWYVQTAKYDNADRTVEADTGAKSPELMGSDGFSKLKTKFTKRGTVLDVYGSYGTLAKDVVHDADGLPQSITYGDLAKTKTEYSYDDRLRLKNVITYRGPPTQWNPTAYVPAPTYGTGAPTTFQLVLQNYDYTYDAVDNPTEIRDWRIASEWPAGSKPVSRKIDYDDLYRVKKVDYTYEAGDDAWTSPFDAENKAASNPSTLDSKLAKPSPHVSFDKRVRSQSFAYDAIGNSTQTDDDAHGFYDRSLGTITNDTAGGKPYQLKAASIPSGTDRPRAGHLTAAYDGAGNLTSMAVQRDGACLPAGAQCSQRYVYDWDEAGRLVHARRWDLASAGAASDGMPTGTAAADLTYVYDSGDQRVRKTAKDAGGNELHTLYPLGSLEVRRAAFANGVYERSFATEVPYLLAHGVRLGRVAYEDSDVPKFAWDGLPAGRLHVFLEIADHLGSASIVIDKATGELVEAGTYQAYGAAESDYRPERWKSFREDHRFTGKEEDVEVGLVYFGARFLSAQLGRWVSADPLAVHGLGADPNVYAYVSGRALKSVDPVGLTSYDTPLFPSKGSRDLMAGVARVVIVIATLKIDELKKASQNAGDNFHVVIDVLQIRFSLPGHNGCPCGAGCGCGVRLFPEQPTKAEGTSVGAPGRSESRSLKPPTAGSPSRKETPPAAPPKSPPPSKPTPPAPPAPSPPAATPKAPTPAPTGGVVELPKTSFAADAPATGSRVTPIAPNPTLTGQGAGAAPGAAPGSGTARWGTAKGWRSGAEPNSKWTQTSGDGKKAVQNTIYDANGDAVGQVDFKDHGANAPPGHGHAFPPGQPGAGHGPGGSHIDPANVPQGWADIPAGTVPAQTP